MSKVKEVIVFSGFVIDIQENIAVVKVEKSSEKSTNNSVLFIPLEIIVDDLVINEQVSVPIKCLKGGMFKVETNKDSPREPEIEKFFFKNLTTKVAQINFQKAYDLEFKFLSGTSMQAISTNLSSEYIAV
jgi:hypothetical protein